MKNKLYLGDSVYVESDGENVIITTENGGPPSNKIYLEPIVVKELQLFIESLRVTDEEATENN